MQNDQLVQFPPEKYVVQAFDQLVRFPTEKGGHVVFWLSELEMLQDDTDDNAMLTLWVRAGHYRQVKLAISAGAALKIITSSRKQ